jgi:DNA primase
MELPKWFLDCEMEVTHRATRELTVSGGFSLDTKEQVRQAIDIVDLVGSYVPLRRQGRGYVGLCPWHDDTKPSLQVNPERQSFKCWVCDVGGDVFSFIMKAEGVEFREALEMLAERAGIALRPRHQPHPDASGAERSEAGPSDRKTLLRAMAWAEGQYHRCLLESPDAEPARQYLQRRGITSESIEKFHLGFSPDRWEWILAQAEGGVTRAKVLETIGLLIRRDDGSRYDRFKGRVLFSIRDAQGRPVGLGGRVLPELGATNPAKYINSPETPLFTKSKLLYGLDVAKDAMRRTGTALVMEGYTDTIVAHQYGFDNAVAVLGTALGDEHVRILNRFVDRVVLVLDGDEAGQKRTNEVLELFIARQVDLRILTLPEGADPCDFLQEHGAEAFRSLLENEAVDALEHARRVFTRGVNLERDVHGASQALDKMVAVLAKASRPSGEQRFREDKILNRLAQDFAVPEKDIRDRLAQLRRRSRKPVYSSPAEGPPAEPMHLRALHERAPGECELLEILISRPELLPAAREAFPWEQITLGPLRRIYRACCRLADEGAVPDFSRLMLEFDEAAMKTLLVELDESPRTAGLSDASALLQELIERYRHRQIDQRHPAQVAALKNEGLDESQKQDLLQAMMAELRARHGISEPTDG